MFPHHTGRNPQETAEVLGVRAAPGGDRVGPDGIDGARNLPRVSSELPTTLTFPARVYGILDGAYLSGRVGEDEVPATSVMVPLGLLERRPELGEEIPVSVVVQPVERAP